MTDGGKKTEWPERNVVTATQQTKSNQIGMAIWMARHLPSWLQEVPTLMVVECLQFHTES